MQPWRLRIIGLLFGAGVVALAVIRPQALGFSPKSKEATPNVQATSAPRASPATSSNGPLPTPPHVLRKDRFSTLEDGGPIPPLPADAPRTVRFGVILFPYAGAELADPDAPSRAEALSKASSVIAEARVDFSAAAKKGSPGSQTSAGRIAQGVLEPAVEYAVFRLKKAEVSDPPIDTPRGFWVVRRLD